MLHCISTPTGPRLNRLAKTYELIWASGWEDRANDYLPHILGVPEFPYLTFDGRAQFGTAHWKLEALEEYAQDRAAGLGRRQPRCQLLRVGRRARGPDPAGPDRLGDRPAETHVGALEAWPSGRLRGLDCLRSGGRDDHSLRGRAQDPGVLRHLARLVGVARVRRVRTTRPRARARTTASAAGAASPRPRAARAAAPTAAAALRTARLRIARPARRASRPPPAQPLP